MKVVLVFPTELEAKNFEIPQNSKQTIDILISGIGVYATMYSLTKYCLQSKPDMIIHAGICGAFSNVLQLGDVVQVVSDCFADVGVYETNEFTSIFDMKFVDENAFPFTQTQLQLQNPIVHFLQQVSGVTVNTITSTEQQKQMCIKKYNPSIESMEGAAVHYVALQENIPCIHLRAVSNYVGERDKSRWNINLALKNLYNNIHLYISSL